MEQGTPSLLSPSPSPSPWTSWLEERREETELVTRGARTAFFSLFFFPFFFFSGDPSFPVLHGLLPPLQKKERRQHQEFKDFDFPFSFLFLFFSLISGMTPDPLNFLVRTLAKGTFGREDRRNP